MQKNAANYNGVSTTKYIRIKNRFLAFMLNVLFYIVVLTRYFYTSICYYIFYASIDYSSVDCALLNAYQFRI